MKIKAIKRCRIFSMARLEVSSEIFAKLKSYLADTHANPDVVYLEEASSEMMHHAMDEHDFDLLTLAEELEYLENSNIKTYVIKEE